MRRECCKHLVLPQPLLQLAVYISNVNCRTDVQCTLHASMQFAKVCSHVTFALRLWLTMITQCVLTNSCMLKAYN